MTPTLFGRWQTRVFLLATVGAIFSLPFYFGLIGNQPSPVYFFVLFYIGLFGLAWDILYDFLQKFMWDHDWPGVFQFIAAIIEAIFLAIIITFIGLPQIDATQFHIDLFALHYSVVWVAVYIASWVLMRLLFPRARFRGGQWLGKWPKGNA
ncbi:MAG: hypothetical protein ACFKPT_31325 [Gloeotrichia echinulata GP01]